MTTLSFFQPRSQSSFVPTKSPLPITIIINLSAKSDQKPIEQHPYSSELKLSKLRGIYLERKQNFDFYINTL